MKKILLIILFVFTSLVSYSQSFTYNKDTFLLNGKPFQIIGGELHFQRIPKEYWKDRLLKAKAMGLNTIGTYIFWNKLEPEKGKWDYSGNNNLQEFLKIAKELDLYVLLRPGPYACAEWDFGGLPPWLLKIPDIKVRCMDDRYMKSVENYIKNISAIIKDFQISKGGNILMLQIENEYGSYGNDKEYLLKLKELWEKNDIKILFYTADGASPQMLEAGTIPNIPIGLDPATSENEFNEGKKINNEVPIFCSELYPGWLTHWGEKWARGDSIGTLKGIEWLLSNKKSFSMYVVHGGTNFGFSAGANLYDKYEPHITSYDYDAPIRENGDLTPKYFLFRNLIKKYINYSIPEPPNPMKKIIIPEIIFNESTSIFDYLPKPIKSVQPKSMEAFDQNNGLILYKTKLIGHHSGKLEITELNDYANVYVNGKFIGNLDRTRKQNKIDIPSSEEKNETVEILVEGMGRANYGKNMIDRKGITERVSLNGMTLMNWEVFCFPLDKEFIDKLKFSRSEKSKNGLFFRSEFDLNEIGDTYLDMSKWSKGMVWVNGNNLGRYWEIGPQQRLYLPGTFLNSGKNSIIVFEMNKTTPFTIKSFEDLEE